MTDVRQTINALIPSRMPDRKLVAENERLREILQLWMRTNQFEDMSGYCCYCHGKAPENKEQTEQTGPVDHYIGCPLIMTREALKEPDDG